MNTCVYIVAAKRTAIGRFQGSLASLSAVELGAAVVKGLMADCTIPVEDIDEVIVGNVLSAGLGMCVGRQIAIHAGINRETPAYTVNMACGSGMKSVLDACAHIKAGDAEIVLAVGTESMSNASFVLPGSIRRGHRFGQIESKDTILEDGLIDAFHHFHIGVTAEYIAGQYAISRAQQDEYALRAQNKAQYAQNNQLFRSEIVPLAFSYQQETLFEQDEQICTDGDISALAELQPLFSSENEGSVTSGNAASFADGASALLIVSEAVLQRYRLQPLAEIVGYGQGGVEPHMMALGAVPAIAQTLERSDYGLMDMERIELHESFAAQSISVLIELAQQHECDYAALAAITNPQGGAIALGHPLGCSGNRIITTLVHGLRRDAKSLGIAAVSIGGGMGCAVMIRVCND